MKQLTKKKRNKFKPGCGLLIVIILGCGILLEWIAAELDKGDPAESRKVDLIDNNSPVEADSAKAVFSRSGLKYDSIDCDLSFHKTIFIYCTLRESEIKAFRNESGKIFVDQLSWIGWKKFCLVVTRLDFDYNARPIQFQIVEIVLTRYKGSYSHPSGPWIWCYYFDKEGPHYWNVNGEPIPPFN